MPGVELRYNISKRDLGERFQKVNVLKHFKAILNRVDDNIIGEMITLLELAKLKNAFDNIPKKDREKIAHELGYEISIRQQTTTPFLFTHFIVPLIKFIQKECGKEGVKAFAEGYTSGIELNKNESFSPEQRIEALFSLLESLRSQEEKGLGDMLKKAASFVMRIFQDEREVPPHIKTALVSIGEIAGKNEKEGFPYFKMILNHITGLDELQRKILFDEYVLSVFRGEVNQNLTPDQKALLFERIMEENSIPLANKIDAAV